MIKLPANMEEARTMHNKYVHTQRIKAAVRGAVVFDPEMKIIGYDIDVGKDGVMVVKIKYAKSAPSLPIENNDLDAPTFPRLHPHLLT